jgi:hypothetical protein
MVRVYYIESSHLPRVTFRQSSEISAISSYGR